MEQNSELGWVQDIQEVINPFPTTEEYSSPPQLGMANEDSHVEEKDPFAAVPEKKRQRTRFNIYQRAELVKAFTASPYLAPRHRLALAERLNVKPVAVQSWFKNRRFKWRKEVREGSNSPSQGLSLARDADNERVFTCHVYIRHHVSTILAIFP